MSSTKTTKSASERLKTFRSDLGTSQQDLADRLSLPQRTYAAYERGRLPPQKVLTDLAKMGLDLHWLIVGEPSAGLPALSDRVEPTVRVPIYAAHLGAAFLGAGGEPSDEIVSYGDVWVEWLRDQARVNPARAFIAPIYGSSMLRLYANGDLVVGETVDELERDDTYALWHDEQLLVKHVRRQRGGLDLISENPSFPPIQLRGSEIEPDRLRIIGRVAGKVTGHIV